MAGESSLPFWSSSNLSDKLLRSFRSTPAEPGADARFVFCAFAICSLLGREAWGSINVPSALAFLARCRTYEGAFGQCPGQESHAGSTYCTLAALKLAGRLDAELSEVEQRKIARWLLARQVGGSGFAGRVSKDADVCYSFWVGASLQVSILCGLAAFRTR